MEPLPKKKKKIKYHLRFSKPSNQVVRKIKAITELALQKPNKKSIKFSNCAFKS